MKLNRDCRSFTIKELGGLRGQSKKVKKGKFITFEGIDGSGKTSLVKAIACNLRKLGFDVLTTQEPGGTQLGRRLREVFLSNSSSSDFVQTEAAAKENRYSVEKSSFVKKETSAIKEKITPACEETFFIEEGISAIAEALLFAADRAQHVEFLIKPALKAGKIVISDRFADSSLAYQAGGRKLPLKMVRQLIKIASPDLMPDLTILLDLPVEKAILRKRNQGLSVNRIDTETVEFYERVRQTYLKLAVKEPKRFRIVSADKPYEQVKNETLNLIIDFLDYSSLTKNDFRLPVPWP